MAINPNENTILEIAKEKPDNAYSPVSQNNINYKQALFE